MDGVQKAKSGHPGMPMGMADVAAVLFLKHLKYMPADPDWPDRDRFVLSAGHGSMLLYSLLHLAGYDLPLEELQAASASGTAGRPATRRTATRPASRPPPARWARAAATPSAWRWPKRMLAARFNTDGMPAVDHHTYVICRRRRPDGGPQPRGLLPGRPPRPEQADRLLRRQPHHHRGLHRPGLQRRREASASRATTGTCSRSTRHDYDADRAGPSARPRARRTARRIVICHIPHRLRQPEQARHRRGPRRAAGRGRSPRHQAATWACRRTRTSTSPTRSARCSPPDARS